jgi:hypothetical protein
MKSGYTGFHQTTRSTFKSLLAIALLLVATRRQKSGDRIKPFQFHSDF